MKRTKIIKKLSLAYWEVYSRKLNLSAAAKDWREAGGKKTARPIERQVKKAEHTLDGIELSAKALGISLDELQTARSETDRRR
ncbi:hypothetical protein [Acutalibacter sp. 1XD8-36]|uniref:hypothetical protein n=1 Tax=Acutalibacter sp. 1XD8-36 TaxID=2320852 RepID=UPI0013733539|nr:hypothetical protein [Acutalibacter sp. 1XD8-36]